MRAMGIVEVCRIWHRRRVHTTTFKSLAGFYRKTVMPQRNNGNKIAKVAIIR
jgi:hypothetical protein